MNYKEAFLLHDKYKSLLTGKPINIVNSDNKELLITDVIVTPFGHLHKVCVVMKQNLMNNEEALAYMQKNNSVYAVYVINSEESTLLHINLLKYLAAMHLITIV